MDSAAEVAGTIADGELVLIETSAPALEISNRSEMEAMLAVRAMGGKRKAPGWTIDSGFGGFWFWHHARLWKPYSLAESAQIEEAYRAQRRLCFT